MKQERASIHEVDCEVDHKLESTEYVAVVLSDLELRNLALIRKQHTPHCNNSSLALIVIPGEIGPSYHVRCRKCGKRYDITDYRSW